MLGNLPENLPISRRFTNLSKSMKEPPRASKEEYPRALQLWGLFQIKESH